MMAPHRTSSSFSIANGEVLLTRAHHWGDVEQPSDRTRITIDVGNRCARAWFSIIRELEQRRMPWLLENLAPVDYGSVQSS